MRQTIINQRIKIIFVRVFEHVICQTMATFLFRTQSFRQTGGAIALWPLQLFTIWPIEQSRIPQE